MSFFSPFVVTIFAEQKFAQVAFCLLLKMRKLDNPTSHLIKRNIQYI